MLKFFKDFVLLASILPLSPRPVATAPGSDFVTNRMKFESNCISTFFQKFLQFISERILAMVFFLIGDVSF